MVDTTPIWNVNEETHWEEVQMKTFCNWVNMHLSKQKLRVQNLETDLCDGVKLIALLEILNGKPIEGRYYKNPKSKPYKIDNVSFALNFITDVFEVRLIGCSPEDIVDGNIKIILGMLWRLIQRFQLSKDNNSRLWLLNWVNETLKDYPDVTIQNFQSSVQDGMVFCALIHNYDNNFIDYKSLQRDQRINNLRTAFEKAEEYLEIPQLIDPIDISNGLTDERSVMTYLSMIKSAYELKSNTGVTRYTPKVFNEVAEKDRENHENQLQGKVESLVKQSCDLESQVKTLNTTIERLTQENITLKEDNQRLRAQIAHDLEESEDSSASDLPSPLVSPTAAPAPAPSTIVVKTPTPATVAEKSRPRENEEPPGQSPSRVTPRSVKDSSSSSSAHRRASHVSSNEPEVQKPSSPTLTATPATTQTENAVKREVTLKSATPAPAPAPTGADAETEQIPPTHESDVDDGSAANTPSAARKKDPTSSKIKKQARVIGDLQRINKELQQETEEIREKLRHQVKVSETLQKSLEDTREEISMLQKQQKRGQDRMVKKIQKRSTKRIQRRDKEIESLKSNHVIEIQQKATEIATLRHQLKKIQEALGGSMAPRPAIIEADIQALRSERDDLYCYVKLFEEEEEALRKRAEKDQDDEDDD